METYACLSVRLLCVCMYVCLITLHTRRVISSVAVQQPEPASAQPTLPRCDNNIEHLEQDIQVKSLTQSSQPGVVPVTDLTESTTDDQMAVDIKCQDDQFDHFEEVQER